MQPTADTVWHYRTKELLDMLDTGILAARTKAVHFYAPSFTYYKTSYYNSLHTHFPTISVTGTACALNCKHCEGKVLKTMYPATTPEKLFALATKLKRQGNHENQTRTRLNSLCPHWHNRPCNSRKA
jgi:hypothetical protein